MTTCNNNWFIEKLQAYAALEPRVLQIVEASSTGGGGGGLLLLLRRVARAAVVGGHPPPRWKWNADGDSAGAGGVSSQDAMTMRVPSAREKDGEEGAEPHPAVWALGTKEGTDHSRSVSGSSGRVRVPCFSASSLPTKPYPSQFVLRIIFLG